MTQKDVETSKTAGPIEKPEEKKKTGSKASQDFKPFGHTMYIPKILNAKSASHRILSTNPTREQG